MKGDRPIAVVTGATREGRVGLEIARHLARAGCDLVVTHTQDLPSNFQQVRDELADLGASCRIERLDLDDPAGAESWAKGLDLPRVDVLVHNASRYVATPTDTVNAAEIERNYRVNALSPLLISRVLAARLTQSPLAGGGAIVAMADIHAMGELGQARRGYVAYSMSKAALLEMVMVLARELAPRVRVNAVAPGVVAFPDYGQDADQEVRARYIARVPLGRSGTPAEAASAVAWLALQATYCTGQVIRVDGGRNLT